MGEPGSLSGPYDCSLIESGGSDDNKGCRRYRGEFSPWTTRWIGLSYIDMYALTLSQF